MPLIPMNFYAAFGLEVFCHCNTIGGGILAPSTFDHQPLRQGRLVLHLESISSQIWLLGLSYDSSWPSRGSAVPDMKKCARQPELPCKSDAASLVGCDPCSFAALDGIISLILSVRPRQQQPDGVPAVHQLATCIYVVPNLSRQLYN